MARSSQVYIEFIISFADDDTGRERDVASPKEQVEIL